MNVTKFMNQCDCIVAYMTEHPDNFDVFDFDMMHVDDRVRAINIVAPTQCGSVEVLIGLHMPGHSGLLKKYNFKFDMIHEMDNFDADDMEKEVIAPFEIELGNIICRMMDDVQSKK